MNGNRTGRSRRHARYFAVEDGILHTQVSADPPSQVFEVAERVAIPGDEIALPVLDIGERSEFVDFQLENVVSLRLLGRAR